MARGRMVDKRVSMSKKLGQISDKAKVLWFMILPHLDREGRIAFDDLEDLKDEIVPKFKNWQLKTISAAINELADIKLIKLYPNGENIAISYTKFEDFQTGLRKDREAPSKVKCPTSVSSGVFRISPALRLNKVKVNEGRNEVKKGSPKGDLSTLEAKPVSKSEEIKFKWNDFAEKYGLSPIRDIKKGSTREKHLRARMGEKDFNFDFLLEMISKSPFLLGKSKEPFFVAFDWIIKPSNYQKIIEGNYLERKGQGKFVTGGDW